MAPWVFLAEGKDPARTESTEVHFWDSTTNTLLGEAQRSVSERGSGLRAGHRPYALDYLDSHYSLKMLNRNQPRMPGYVASSTLATRGFSYLQPFKKS